MCGRAVEEFGRARTMSVGDACVARGENLRRPSDRARCETPSTASIASTPARGGGLAATPAVYAGLGTVPFGVGKAVRERSAIIPASGTDVRGV